MIFDCTDVKAFLFDLDGTLVDTEAFWAQAIADCLASSGAAVTGAEILEISWGRSWPDIRRILIARFPSAPFTSPEADADLLRPYYRRLVDDDPAKTIIPGSIAFFRRAVQTAPCAIVSGSPHADVVAAAELCGIDKDVSFILGGEDYSNGKPDPECFLKAAERFGVEARHCVVVEDSPAGVRAAVSAGMRAIARVPHGHEDDPAYALAALRVSELSTVSLVCR